MLFFIIYERRIKVKILITGIGITGKSTLRRRLVKLLRTFDLSAKHYDADEFKELRDPADKDCLNKLPEKFSNETVYVIEDVHGLLKSAVLPSESYDLIIYVRAGFLSHLLFWLPRIVNWFNRGKFSWEQKEGWQGTGKPCDLRNVSPIFKDLLNNFRNRRKWMAEDLEAIKFHPHIIVRSIWTRNGLIFILEI